MEPRDALVQHFLRAGLGPSHAAALHADRAMHLQERCAKRARGPPRALLLMSRVRVTPTDAVLISAVSAIVVSIFCNRWPACSSL